MSISSKVSRLGLVAAGVLALGLTPALAQDYPSRAVDFIVPFDPGGGADSSQRTFNKFAEPIVGQPLVIVNKPGAGGTKGWAEMVRAQPDGYTLAIVTPPFNVIPALARPQATGFGRLAQRDRDRGGRGVAIAIDVHQHSVARQAEGGGGRFDDAAVRLVRHE